MESFENVTLELVRPGPSHNQLLSPLTPYMALCGEGQPVTFHINIEHRKLLNRLRRLRYVSAEGSQGSLAIPDPMREAEVTDLGEEVASILAQIQTLNSEISRAQGSAASSMTEQKETLVHLRLVFSGSELSLIPFELAIAPQAFPGEGLEFCLQGTMPIVITREIRRSRPMPLPWDQPIEPRILFISAEPQGLSVPKKAHIHALRQAMESWIRWPRDQSTKRTSLVKERLRLLINPSVTEIYQECAAGQFTHIHILAHGASYEEAGEKRFGLALCQEADKNQADIVSGKRLAKVLQASFSNCSPGRSHPLFVMLATCDSGNTGSMLIPGGSIAHDLHSEGIPWVFASQFPLTKKGSIKATETLYPCLLHGEDPRLVLYEVRRQLYMTSDHDHDWASLIAYVTIPSDSNKFSQQVSNFFERQKHRAIEVSFDRADNCDDTDELCRNSALAEVETLLESWKKRLPTGQSVNARTRRAECYGLHGSAYKRIALLCSESKEKEKQKEAMEKYAISLKYYKLAMSEMVIENSRYYWTATQYLCLNSVIDSRIPDIEIFRFVRKLVKEDIDNSDRENQAWAYGTLAELELLSLFHQEEKDKNKLVKEQVKKKVLNSCNKIIEIMGAESFHAVSTARQFKRYTDHWLEKESDGYNIAQAAVEALTPDNADETFPPY